MGWTGTPVSGRPKTEEVNRIINDAIKSPRYRVIDRSGWTNWDRQYLLCELNPDVTPDNPARRFIMVARARSSATELRYKIMEETEGPAETHCTLRILRAADLYPAPNLVAAQWRKDCRKYHEDNHRFNVILRQIDENPPEADRRILLHGGRVVYYCKVRSRRQNVRAYHEMDGDQLYRLNMKTVDIPGTIALRETPASSATPTSSRNS